MMKERFAGLVLGLLLVACLMVGLGGGVAASEAEGDQSPVERYCTHCHGLDRIEAKKVPAVKWWMTIRRMATYDGFDLDTAQQKEVFDYIKENLAIDGPGGRQETLDKSMPK